MSLRSNERQLVWLLFGVIGGLCLAYFWPHEHVLASATDRDTKFAICTVDVGPGMPDAVFVLDLLTGKLYGGLLNPQAQAFTNFWVANVAVDFKVPKNGKFTMIPGSGLLNAPAGGGGAAIATGVIYIGEVTTGTVGCYRFNYVNSVNPLPPIPLQAVDSFQFREGK